MFNTNLISCATPVTEDTIPILLGQKSCAACVTHVSNMLFQGHGLSISPDSCGALHGQSLVMH